ncbi:alpha/beta hydrolase family protein [Roseobacter sinensis]|uniref:Alpha/beta fold hydrolase n=1 Tax=Roseobacter sinensis TaxID=2931391 RepID=A0ABT3BDQ8_9RHOB|nr:alpha/beta fold hydrolase [Roseobacter sp. WL0113]MCV3271721.1 alpha/beta fold hydrolase [Roseobacter sp. WL0113]
MLKVVETPVVRRRLIKTPDGAELGGTLFRPAFRPRAALVLNGATGVPQGYYRAFAQWAAAEHAIAVLTYDYRGTGRSLTGAMRASRATMSDWGLRDNAAARRHLRRAVPDVPLWVMGHSLGAMMLPMQDDVSGIDGVIGVASGLVHHADHPWPYRALALYFWYGLPPLAAAMLGYLPGRRMGLGADMPATAYAEWRRWCTTPGVFAGEVRDTLPRPDWRRSAAPVRLVSFTDDDVCPEVCTRRLAGLYDGFAQVEVISPAELGVRRVGHIGAFARQNEAIWPALLFGQRPIQERFS